MDEGAIVKYGVGEGIGTVDQDGATTKWLEYGNGNCIPPAKCCLLYRGLRRCVEFQNEVSLSAPASQDCRAGACWQ